MPNVAYENLDTFISWTDFIYDAGKAEPYLISTLGSILGRSSLGTDGIFPHENVRVALEKYSNDALTRGVATGWFNSRGARFVQDGLNERKMELQYRAYARDMELEYPQTAKILSSIADDYRWEAKHHERLSAFAFSKCNIPVGAEIEFSCRGNQNSGSVCTVADDKHVKYNGEIWSLTGLAKHLLGTNGSIPGPKYFKYQGEWLSDIRRRIEGRD